MEAPEGLGGLVAKKFTESESLLLEIYKDLAQPGVKQVGMALESVLDFATLALLPFKYGSKAARMNMENKFERYRKKIEATPEEKIVSVPPEIGVPLLEKLSHTTNESLSELFLNLLAKASNTDTASTAHPAFISMIERLSIDEAIIVNHLIDKSNILYTNIRFLTPEGSYVEPDKYLTDLLELNLTFPNDIPTYLNNLTGMGILNDEAPKHFTDLSKYDKIKKIHGNVYETLVEIYRNSQPTFNPDWDYSFFSITPFGKMFIMACTEKAEAERR